MAGKQLPSIDKQESMAVQSLADRTGQNQEMSRKMQSEIDKREIKKHGQ